MLHRIALIAASVVAALVIAGGLALSGFGPQPAADAVQVVDAVAGPVDAAAPDPTVQVDTIYLAPQATPGIIDVTRVKQASHPGDDEDGEHEGGRESDD